MQEQLLTIERERLNKTQHNRTQNDRRYWKEGDLPTCQFFISSFRGQPTKHIRYETIEILEMPGAFCLSWLPLFFRLNCYFVVNRLFWIAFLCERDAVRWTLLVVMPCKHVIPCATCAFKWLNKMVRTYFRVGCRPINSSRSNNCGRSFRGSHVECSFPVRFDVWRCVTFETDDGHNTKWNKKW